MEERLDILDLIRKSKKYEIALFTTFNFDIAFFEKLILNKLNDNGIKKVSLFVDNKEFVKSLNDVYTDGLYLGRKYMVTPVDIKGSFHPKVILFLGKDKARLIISSCNLTPSGYLINNEVINYYDFNEENTDNLKLIQDAVKFFKDINEQTDKRDGKLINELDKFKYLKQNCSNNNNYFISNINESMISQITNIMKNDTVEDIDIAVPYFDKEINCLNTIKTNFSLNSINLYVQNMTSSYPEKYKDEYKLNIFDKVIDFDSSNFYHGKLFRFKCNDKSYVFFGSANCTAAAFLKSFKDDHGNIEACILTKGEKEEYNYYFDNFNIVTNVNFESSLLKYDDVDNNNFYYINNEPISNEKVILLFKYKNNFNDLKIFYNSEELKYQNEHEYLKVELDINKISHSIYEIEFDCDNKKYLVRCYINIFSEIEINRTQGVLTKVNINVNPSSDINSGKYYEEKIELINNYNSLLEENDILGHHNELSNEEPDLYIGDEDDDFIDHDYVYKDNINNNLTIIEKVRKANNNIFNSYRLYVYSLEKNNNNNSKTSSESTNTNNDNNKKVTRRQPTTEEKKFSRLVYKISDEILKDEFWEKISLDDYIKCISTIFDTFDRHLNDEKKAFIFDIDKVLHYKIELISRLIEKNNTSDENKEMIAIMIISAIKNIQMIDDKEFRQRCVIRTNQLLLKIEKKFNLRKNDNIIKEEAFKTSYLKYLNLILINEEEINQKIKKVYGDNSSIYVNGDQYIIESSTSKINNYLNINDCVKDIIKYIKGIKEDKNGIKTIIIKINSNNCITEGNPLVSVRYEISVAKREYILIRKYKDGSEPKEKSKRISF